MFRIFLAVFISAAVLFDFTRAQETAAEPKPPEAPVAEPPSEPKVQTGAETRKSAETKRAPSEPAKTSPAAKKAKSTPSPISTPAPTATPAPKKQGFWARLFGRRPRPERRPPAPGMRRAAPKKVAPAPAPAPVKATPRPKPGTKTQSARNVAPSDAGSAKRTPGAGAAKRPAKPAPSETGNEPGATEKKREKPDEGSPEKPVDRPPPSPANADSKPGPQARVTPKTAGKPKREVVATKPAPEPPAGSDAETVEQWKYNEARRKALEDSRVQELKEKADNVSDEGEARKAMRAYNRALFEKMRKVDPTIKERVDGTEAAVMKRLGESP